MVGLKKNAGVKAPICNYDNAFSNSISKLSKFNFVSLLLHLDNRHNYNFTPNTQFKQKNLKKLTTNTHFSV
jgi:hypothetical protein